MLVWVYAQCMCSCVCAAHVHMHVHVYVVMCTQCMCFNTTPRKHVFLECLRFQTCFVAGKVSDAEVIDDSLDSAG